MEITITLPSSARKSGKTETVGLVISWEVLASRPMRPRDWTRQEINSARDKFASVKDSLDDGEEFTIAHANDLGSSLTHAIRAWCRTHLRCKDAMVDDCSYVQALCEKSPESLLKLTCRARMETSRLGFESGAASTRRVIEAVQTAVDALLEAASSPPRNRRRFPARLKAGRSKNLRKPRVRPGSWIHTGRYRPAVVLEVKPDPPHTMKLSWGDEVEDFQPHVNDWKSVRKRKRMPSLKDVFSPGDWIRHPRDGHGQVVEVRNSVMDVRYRKRGMATVVPNAALREFEKVDDPGPEDTRPAAERFPPGTRIEVYIYGQGVVLESDERVTTIDGKAVETITVLFSDRVDLVPVMTTDEGPVIWKPDRTPLDLGSPFGRRWAWWWRHRNLSGETVCACCGYPNFGSGLASCAGSRDCEYSSRDCIICGFPDFATGFENDGEPCVFYAEGCWRHRDAWFFPDPDDESEHMSDELSDRHWEDFGYSILQARRNYENSGTIFRPGDSGALRLKAAEGLRQELVRVLERTMADPSGWRGGDEKVVEELRRRILSELNAAPPGGT